MKKHARLIAGIAVGIVIGALIFVGFLMSKSDNSASAQPGTVQIGETEKVDSLTGSWTADKMTATVTDMSIEVMWMTEEMSGLYWKGSFVVAAKDGEKINSAGDLVAMEESFISSRDTEKEFVYENGKLSFKRTVMGVTTVIHLVRK
jgi:hypothetical protein